MGVAKMVGQIPGCGGHLALLREQPDRGQPAKMKRKPVVVMRFEYLDAAMPGLSTIPAVLVRD